MDTSFEVKATIGKITADYLGVWLEAFLIDRRSQNLSPNTLRYYRNHLQAFSAYCEGQAVETLEQVSPDVLRHFLLWLEVQNAMWVVCYQCFIGLKLNTIKPEKDLAAMILQQLSAAFHMFVSSGVSHLYLRIEVF